MGTVISLHLYELTEQLEQLFELAEQIDGGDDEQAIYDTLEALDMTFAAKATNIARVIKSAEAEAAAIKAEEQRMAKRRRAVENKAAWLMDYLKRCMDATGSKEIKDDPALPIKMVNNPPSVSVIDERSIPGQYFEVPPPPPPKLDKRGLLAALKENPELCPKGATLVRTTRVKIG